MSKKSFPINLSKDEGGIIIIALSRLRDDVNDFFKGPASLYNSLKLSTGLDPFENPTYKAEEFAKRAEKIMGKILDTWPKSKMEETK